MSYKKLVLDEIKVPSPDYLNQAEIEFQGSVTIKKRQNRQ